MAEPSSYAEKEADTACESRRCLPIEVQAELLDIRREICANLKQYPPSQLKPMNRDGTTLLYSHPDPKVQVTFELDEEEGVLWFMHYALVKIEVKKKVFVSYAREDAPILAELRTWLKPLEREKLIELWDDTQIRAGDEWLKIIERELERARLALLLVSEHFAHSEFIREHELLTILRNVDTKGVRLLWIMVSATPLETLGLDKFQGLNLPDKPLAVVEGSAREDELEKIYLKIEDVVKNT